MTPDDDYTSPDDIASGDTSGDDETPTNPAIRMPELPDENTSDDSQEFPEDRPDPAMTMDRSYVAPGTPVDPLLDLPYEYVHPACGGVAFRMTAPTLLTGEQTCNHCGAKLSPRTLNPRHIRETRPANELS